MRLRFSPNHRSTLKVLLDRSGWSLGICVSNVFPGAARHAGLPSEDPFLRSSPFLLLSEPPS